MRGEVWVERTGLGLQALKPGSLEPRAAAQEVVVVDGWYSSVGVPRLYVSS